MAPFLIEEIVPGVKTLDIEVDGMKEMVKTIMVTEGFPKPTWNRVLHNYKPMSQILESPAGFLVMENLKVWRRLEEGDDDSDWETDVESDDVSKQELMKYEESSGDDGYEASGENEDTTSEEEKEKVFKGTKEGEDDGKQEQEGKPDAKAKKKSLQQRVKGIFKKNIVFPEIYAGKEKATVKLVVMEPIEEEESVEGSSDSMVDVPPACGSLCSLLSN